MAVKYTNLGSKGSSNTDELLQKLMLQYGKQSTPKVGMFNRILAPLTGIGSIVDAYHDARFEDKDAGVGNVLKNYGKNLLQGLGTLATGTKYEEMQGMSELLDKTNPDYKRSNIGSSVLGRMGVDVLAGLITDPTTYIGNGAISLGDDVIKGLLKGVPGMTDDVITKVLPKVAGGTVDDVTKTLIKEFGTETADAFYVKALSQFGKSQLNSGALKVFGKTVSQNQNVVRGVKAIENPLGLATDLGKGAVKKLAPDVYSNAQKIFDPVAAAAEMGKEELALGLSRQMREASALQRKATSELTDAEIISTYKNLTKKERADLRYNIEDTREALKQAENAQGVYKRKDEVLEAMDELLNGKTQQVDDMFPEGQFDIAGQKGAFDVTGKKGQSSFDDLLQSKYNIGFGDKTGMSNVDRVFNEGEYGYLNGKKVPIKEYMEKAKNKGFEKTTMTPDEYLQAAYKVESRGDTTFEQWLEAANSEKVNKYKKMMSSGTKMDVPWIEYGKYGGQEGRHRALAAKQLGLEKIPVIVEYPSNEIPDILKKTVPDELVSATSNTMSKKLDDLISTMSPDEAEVLSDLILKVSTGDETTIGMDELNKLFENHFGNLVGEGAPSLVTKGNLSEAEQLFMQKYFGLEHAKTAQLESRGLPTIDLKERGYLSRVPTGAKEKFINNVLKKEVGEEKVAAMMARKNVIRELEEKGSLSNKTLKKYLGNDFTTAMKRYEPGLLGDLIGGNGAVKDRAYDTFKQAEAAGLVYGDDPIMEIFDQTVRQNEQVGAVDFVNKMFKMKDTAGKDMFTENMVGTNNIPVKIPHTGKTMYTDKFTAEIAEEYFSKYATTDSMDELLSTFDKLQSFWKGTVTGGGLNAPAYHARNALDDNLRMVLHGVSPTKMPAYYQLSDDVIKYEKLINEVGRDEAKKIFKSKGADKIYKNLGIDTDSAIDDLWDKVVSNGTFGDVTKSTSEMGIKTSEKIKELAGIKKTPAEKIRDIQTLKGKLTEREQKSRMVQFFSSWEKTGSETAAVGDVRKVLFNYDELTPAERKYLKRAIPFYAFVKNNLKFYLDTLKDNPEKIARFKNVYDGLQSGSQSLYGEKWDAMPDYLKETFTIPFGEKEDGSLRYATGLRPSIEGLNDLSLSGMAGNTSPAIKMAIEKLTGKSLYTGNEIMDTNSAQQYGNMPEFVKNLINYNEYDVDTGDGNTFTKKTMSPQAKYLLEQTPYINQWTTMLQRMSNIAGGTDVVENLTNPIVPVKIDSRNVSDAKATIQRKQEEALYELLRKKGIAESFGSYYIPAALKEQLLK